MRLLKHATFAVLATLALSSNAGWIQTEYVTVDYDRLSATGSVRDARNSGDTQQYIGCSLDASTGGNVSIACMAKDSNGQFAYCSSSDPLHVRAVQSINSASYIEFIWLYGTTECWGVLTITGSGFLP